MILFKPNFSCAFLLIVLCFIGVDLHAQNRDTTYSSFDSINHLKKIIRIETHGTGGGTNRNGPRYSKTVILKYNEKGELIYSSMLTIKTHGCFSVVTKWKINATDSMNHSHNIHLNRFSQKVTVKEFDKNGKKLIKKKIDGPLYKDWWMDSYEGTFL